MYNKISNIFNFCSCFNSKTCIKAWNQIVLIYQLTLANFHLTFSQHRFEILCHLLHLITVQWFRLLDITPEFFKEFSIAVLYQFDLCFSHYRCKEKVLLNAYSLLLFQQYNYNNYLLKFLDSRSKLTEFRT